MQTLINTTPAETRQQQLDYKMYRLTNDQNNNFSNVEGMLKMKEQNDNFSRSGAVKSWQRYHLNRGNVAMI